MKRKINNNFKNSNNILIKVVVIFIFLFFISLTLVLSNRNYIFSEVLFKNISGKINKILINNLYSNNLLGESIISSKIDYLEKENNELRNILNLKKQNEEYIVSEVINHNSKIWFNRLEISSGYNNGIKKGYAVINDKGLIGFISKTSKNISEVKLITNISENDMISVVIKNGDEEITGILKEYDNDTKLFKITDCISKSIIKEGSYVTLSGYQNEAYRGVYIGKVVKDEVSNYGLSKTIYVSSDVNFDDILFVLVVKEKK